MRKLFLVMVCVVLATFLFVGCLPDWIAPDEPVEPEVPVVTMEANVDAVVVPILDPGGFGIAWTINNTGEVNIFKYEITFDVTYAEVIVKTNVIVTAEGLALGIGEEQKGIVSLFPYGEEAPVSVSVSWELFN